ncbi:hypothetical protein XU18_2575 [Perkinsela sp. CCAP 1560/4]|nr:hypothetical protein XU18_2575 [Perkinsela sp. CCAP 1560/4]|eukprot:KNH06554.1 hypothetical protein XU18_2575 [Perkinsela sp. CCAP 1560/4]
MFNFKALKDSVLSFVKVVAQSYYTYAIPLGMLFLANASITLHAYDIEKQGLLWLHYYQLGPSEREAAFPADEKTKSVGMTTKDREFIASAL